MMSLLLHISSGTGPIEVRHFVTRLRPVFEELCRCHGLAIAAQVHSGPVHAPRSVGFILPDTARAALIPILGTHCWIHPTRGRHTRQRWFAQVSLHTLPEPQGSLKLQDLSIQTCRAGGPGRQHVNTSATAVIIHHRPTSLLIRADGERSQHANKRAALARLSSILAQHADSARQETQAAIRNSNYQIIRGSPVCTWRGDPLRRSE